MEKEQGRKVTAAEVAMALGRMSNQILNAN